jgi:hypothetical protein
MDNLGKGLASVTLGLLCGIMLYLTHGEHGMGWFIGGLFILWVVA